MLRPILGSSPCKKDDDSRSGMPYFYSYQKFPGNSWLDRLKQQKPAVIISVVLLVLCSISVVIKETSSRVLSSPIVHRFLRIDAVPAETRRENHEDYIQVFEDYLPEKSLHQEGGACRIGTKLFIIGGINSVGEYLLDSVNGAHLGGSVVTIYDMKDMSVTFGPELSFRGNHLNCAESHDGILHVTGGYRQDAPKGEPLAYNHHWTLDTKEPESEWKWVRRADMPQGLGGHGCAFLADRKLYCVGGGVAQMGPYQTDMIIYDPVVDRWTHGPPMHIPRDHCMGSVIALEDGKKLYVVGGKSMITNRKTEEMHYMYWSAAGNAELYDLETNTWTKLRMPLVDRTSIDLVKYYRRGPDVTPNLLLVGGQEAAVYSGYGFNVVEEYDVEKDTYYCHTPLPFPYYSGGIGMHEGKLHIVGGAEWFGVSARRRVMIYDFNRAPPPRQCFYKPVPQFDQWDRFGAMPYPGINDVSSTRGAEMKDKRDDLLEFSTRGGGRGSLVA